MTVKELVYIFPDNQEFKVEVTHFGSYDGYKSVDVKSEEVFYGTKLDFLKEQFNSAEKKCKKDLKMSMFINRLKVQDYQVYQFEVDTATINVLDIYGKIKNIK